MAKSLKQQCREALRKLSPENVELELILVSDAAASSVDDLTREEMASIVLRYTE